MQMREDDKRAGRVGTAVVMAVLSPHNNANDDSDEDEDEDEDDEQEGVSTSCCIYDCPCSRKHCERNHEKELEGRKLALIRRLTSKAVAVEAVKMPEYKLKSYQPRRWRYD